MESDLALELIQDLESNSDMHVQNLVMDEDSATIAPLRMDLDRDIIKLSDFKHVTKSIQSALYKMKTLKNNKDTIQHFVRSFYFAVHQNKDNTDALVKSLSSIVPHAYGEHDACGPWCGYKVNPDTYCTNDSLGVSPCQTLSYGVT